MSSGSTVTLSGSNYSSANYYFWLGGSVGTLPNTQTPGAYSGTFTLQVAYN
jgi:membrane-bound inhibitor of C-type lysozyme